MIDVGISKDVSTRFVWATLLTLCVNQQKTEKHGITGKKAFKQHLIDIQPLVRHLKVVTKQNDDCFVYSK